MSTPLCLYCANKAVKGPKCINCSRVFHPKCVDRLDLEIISEDLVKCCQIQNEGSDPEIVSREAETITSFLKSKEFVNILKSAVDSQLKPLRDELSLLRVEVENLKLSNIDMIKLLTDNSTDTLKPINPITRVNPNINNEANKIVKSDYCMQYTYSDSTANKKLRDKEKKSTDTALFTNTDDDRFHEEVHPEFSDYLSSDEDGRWKLVQRKKNRTTKKAINKLSTSEENGLKSDDKNKKIKRNKMLIGTGSDPSESNPISFFAAKNTKKASLHVTRVDPSVSAESIAKYIENKLNLKENVSKSQNVNVVQITSRFPASYSSFKVTADADALKFFLENDFWPSRVAVRKFFEPKVTKKNEESTKEKSMHHISKEQRYYEVNSSLFRDSRDEEKH